jgi:hypothetical protein
MIDCQTCGWEGEEDDLTEHLGSVGCCPSCGSDNFLDVEIKDGATLIADERKRQVEEEGYTPEHDQGHSEGELGVAGACYALDLAIGPDDEVASSFQSHCAEASDQCWPWDPKWWNPTPSDPVRQLAKAGALIAAEIDRLQKIA